MQFKVTHPGRTFVCRLDYESDLLGSIRMFAEEEKINAAIFSALGALRSLSFAFYNQKTKEYVKKKIRRNLEILSCIGNVAKLDGKTIVHGHIVASDSEGSTYGGHLVEENIVFACELVLTEFPDISLAREYDKTTGLNLFASSSLNKKI